MNQAEKLKKLIKSKGLTQEEFANKMGFSRVYLQSILSKETIKQDYLDRAEQILGQTIVADPTAGIRQKENPIL